MYTAQSARERADAANRRKIQASRSDPRYQIYWIIDMVRYYSSLGENSFSYSGKLYPETSGRLKAAGYRVSETEGGFKVTW